MKFTFIANACGIFTFSKKTKLLMDPWLNDGVIILTKGLLGITNFPS